MKKSLTMMLFAAAFALLARPALAQTCTADGSEPNDLPTTAAAVSVPGTIDNLTGCADDDWYSFTVPANNGLILDLTFVDEDADLDLSIYEAGATSTALHSSASTSDNERIVHLLFEAETQLLVKVRNYTASSDPDAWAAYSMTVTLYPGGYDPCASDDAFEDNDDFSSAAALTGAGTYDSLLGCDDDWYALTVPADNGLVVDLTFADDDANLNLYVYEAGATATYTHSSTSSSDNEKIVNLNYAAGAQLLIRVRNMDEANYLAAPYSMTVSLYPGGYDPCSSDDSYEENDDFSSPAALSGAGLVSDLVGCDEDWFSVTVPADNGVTVDLTFLDDDANLDLYLYEVGATDTALHEATSWDDNEQAFVGRVTQATDLLIRVRNRNADTFLVAPYTMEVAFHPGGFCGEACASDDSYEVNNNADCAADLSAEVPGTVSGLVGCDQEDWFAFNVPANNSVTVDIAFTHADSDLDLSIYDAAEPNSSLDSSAGTSDNESVCADGFGEETPVLVKVRNFNYPDQTANYTMTVTFGTDSCGGPPPTDAGVGTDTASGTDSGSGGTDANITGTDAGSGGGSDAGDDGGDDDGGCGCTAKGSRDTGLLLLVGLGVALLQLRRRRR